MESKKYPKVIQIGIQDGYCNLNCKHCYFHSSDKGDSFKQHRGVMPLDKFDEFVEQIKDIKPIVRIYRHSETLMTPNLEEYITRLKEYDIPISISTNGILLDDKMAKMIIKNKIDNVNISIDAINAQTYMNLKGGDIEKSNDSVFRLLNSRGESCDTRIGVSYVESEINEKETKQFIDYWINYVDYVKVIEKLELSKETDINTTKVSCDIINNEMVINHKGGVNICMFDPMNEHIMGNIFEDGLLNVWNNSEFKNIRNNFNEGNYHLNNHCRKCKIPNEIEPKEWIDANMMIKKYAYATYYNNMNRMSTYKLKRYQDKI